MSKNRELFDACVADWPDLIALIISPSGFFKKLFGATVAARNQLQQYPLHVCTSVDAAKVLIDAGASVADRDRNGRTPLHYAVQLTDPGLARLLVGKGTNINAKDNDQLTPLHWSVWLGKEECAALLVSSGADQEARDAFGRVPQDLADKLGHQSSAELPLESDAGDKPTGSESSGGDDERIEQLKRKLSRWQRIEARNGDLRILYGRREELNWALATLEGVLAAESNSGHRERAGVPKNIFSDLLCAVDALIAKRALGGKSTSK